MVFTTPLTVKELKSYLSSRGVTLPHDRDREKSYYVSLYYELLVEDKKKEHQLLSTQELRERLLAASIQLPPNADHDLALERLARHIVDSSSSTPSGKGKAALKRAATPGVFSSPAQGTVSQPQTPSSPWDPFVPSPESSAPPPLASVEFLTPTRPAQPNKPSPASTPIVVDDDDDESDDMRSIPTQELDRLLDDSTTSVYHTPPSTPLSTSSRSSSWTAGATSAPIASTATTSSKHKAEIRAGYNDDPEKSFTYAWVLLGLQIVIVVLVFAYLQYQTDPEPFRAVYQSILDVLTKISPPLPNSSDVAPQSEL